MTEILGGAVIIDGVQLAGRPFKFGTGMYCADANGGEPQRVEENERLQSLLSRSPLKLNLGCKLAPRDGYVNIDNTAVVDIADDIRSFPYIHTGTVDEIVAVDCFQYIYATDARSTLEEWHRILKPGGVLRVEMPDIREVAKVMAKAGDVAIFDGQPPLVWVANGKQMSYDPIGLTVRNAMTESRMRALLTNVGFADIVNTDAETYAKLKPFALLAKKAGDDRERP